MTVIGPKTVTHWSTQKEAEALYMKGGLAAVYPDVYGENGILARAGYKKWPKDRFAPIASYRPHYHAPFSGLSARQAFLL